MKLHEITGNGMLTNKEDILDWVKHENVACQHDTTYTIDDDLSVSVDGSFSIGPKKNNNTIAQLPVRFKKVESQFDVSYVGLKSLEGFPEVSNSIVMHENRITSFIGISDIIKSCSTMEFEYCKIKSGGLGLLLIENLSTINDDHGNFCGVGYEAFKIIQKYLGKGEDGLIECQSELIEAGFEEFAQL